MLFILIIFNNCAVAGGSSTPEFVGTWVFTGLFTETLVITKTTFQGDLSGPFTGTVTLDIISYNESNNHFAALCTSASGNYTPGSYSPGTTYYYTYDISGDELSFSYSNTLPYPVTHNDCGPYIKQ